MASRLKHLLVPIQQILPLGITFCSVISCLGFLQITQPPMWYLVYPETNYAITTLVALHKKQIKVYAFTDFEPSNESLFCHKEEERGIINTFPVLLKKYILSLFNPNTGKTFSVNKSKDDAA